MLIISMICSYMFHDLSNFIVMSYAISILANDLSAEQKHFFTNIRYSITLFTCGMTVLMLFVIVIHINIILNLVDHSYALSLNNSSSILLLITIGFSFISDKSRSKTLKWNLTCSLHLEKFKPLKMVTNEACK